ncbi:hypothetical protein JTB14_004739 [Gonioctena quinquepunctata]|nr:hypothetical protein JTB14_004739 [Gonioctena quinquepunctata]
MTLLFSVLISYQFICLPIYREPPQFEAEEQKVCQKLVGAAVGSAASFALVSEFKSVFEIIRDDMTPAQRRQLAGSINSILGGMQITNAVSVLALLSRNSNLKSSVLQQIISFFQQEMNMSIL